jgi:hypothetical protein
MTRELRAQLARRVARLSSRKRARISFAKKIGIDYNYIQAARLTRPHWRVPATALFIYVVSRQLCTQPCSWIGVYRAPLGAALRWLMRPSDQLRKE